MTPNATIYCHRCGEPRPPSDFRPNRRVCRLCRNEESRTRPASVEQRRRSAARRYAEARAVLDDRKARPCLDCGGSFPPACMHFDHRDYGTKQRIVSAWCAAGDIPKMLQEIALCDLVCANCHAIRTEQRRQIQGRRGGRPRKYPDYVPPTD